MKDPIESADSQEKIFKVALPVSLEAVFQTSLGFVDQIIVGILGATAVAAVGLCNSISFIVMLLYSAIASATPGRWSSGLATLLRFFLFWRSTKQLQIAELAAARPEESLTSLNQYLDTEQEPAF